MTDDVSPGAWLVRSALGAAPEVAARWSQLAADGRLDPLPPEGHAALPLLYRTLEDLRPDANLARLAGIYKYWWTRNQLLLHEARGLWEALAERGCQPLLVDELAAAAVCYPDAGCRPLARIGLAIRNDARLARRVLDGQGWCPRGRYWSHALLARVEIFARAGSPAPLFLHVHEGRRRHARVLGELWRQAVEVEVAGARLWSIDLTECALGAAAAWNGGRGPNAASLPIDLGLAVRSGRVDWRGLVAESRCRYLVRPVLRSLQSLAVFGVGAPSGVIEALRCSYRARVAEVALGAGVRLAGLADRAGGRLRGRLLAPIGAWLRARRAAARRRSDPGSIKPGATQTALRPQPRAGSPEGPSP